MRLFTGVAVTLMWAASPALALCRPGMAEIEGKFCIDTHEAALLETRASGPSPWSPYHTPLASSTYRAVSAPGLVPQAYISGAQAQAACRNAGKRLCEAKACNEHSHDRKYSGPLQRLHHGSPVYDGPAMNDPRVNQLPDTVARGGAHAECVSPDGVYDLVGNLHEWTAERNKANGVFRGGYFNEAELNGSGCAYKTTAHAFEYHDYSTGFRCCAERVPEPSFN